MIQRTITSTVILFCVVLFAGVSVSAQKIGVDILGGSSWHNPQMIRIGDHLIQNPQWETRPLEDAPYFSIRIRWGGHEIEWLHDKVYMGYDTAAIQNFSMSDGYNTLFYNVPQVWGPFEARLGVGAVIVHPEGTIDGIEIGFLGSPGWRVAGVGIQGSVAYRHEVKGGLSIVTEAKLTTGFAHVSYPGIGEIEVPVTGQHILIGIGFDF